MSPPLPNFLMIGAPRTGTTWLYHALRQHPEIFLSPTKESHFFSAEADPLLSDHAATRFPYWVMTDPNEYVRLFENAASFSLRGEVDPTLLSGATCAVPKIRATLKSPLKFIATLRQPAERAHSHYCLHLGLGTQPRPFEAYVRVTTPRDPWERIAEYRYFRCSLYYAPLKLYFDTFGRENFCVFLYEDLERDTTAFLQTLSHFLGADANRMPGLSKRINASHVPRGPFASLQRLNHPLRKLARDRLPSRLRQYGKRVLKWQGQEQAFFKPPLAADTRRVLTERYRDDILRTQDLIGRDLTHWLA